MLRWMISRQLTAAEERLGAPLDYLRDMLAASPAYLLRFAGGLALLGRRKRVPRDVWHAAALAGTLHEDCGTCLQVGVNLAREEGVPVEVLRALVDRAPERLPEPLAEAYQFGAAVCRADGSEGPWRDALRRRHGDAALVELCLAVAAARVFPTVKRGLGHAVSCSLVQVRV